MSRRGGRKTKTEKRKQEGNRAAVSLRWSLLPCMWSFLLGEGCGVQEWSVQHIQVHSHFCRASQSQLQTRFIRAETQSRSENKGHTYRLKMCSWTSSFLKCQWVHWSYFLIFIASRSCGRLETVEDATSWGNGHLVRFNWTKEAKNVLLWHESPTVSPRRGNNLQLPRYTSLCQV